MSEESPLSSYRFFNPFIAMLCIEALNSSKMCIRDSALRARTYRLLEILNREVQLAEIKESIQMRAREDIDQQQRDRKSVV